MNLLFRCTAAAALLMLGACGDSAEEPLQDISVQDLRGAWLMVNRGVDCRTQYIRFAQSGIFRVFADKRPRKQYAAFTKIVLGTGTISMDVSGLNIGGVALPAATLQFTLADNKLRLTDLKGGDGMSFSHPADSVGAAQQARLKTFFRLEEQRFAMDRCTTG